MRKSPVYTTDQVFPEDFDRRKKISFKFQIDRVNFFKRGFVIATVTVLENNQHILFSQNQVSIKGNMVNPRKGDVYWGTGKLIYDAEHGYVIKLEDAEIKYPKLRKDIIKYIVANIDGLGKIKATKIVDYLGSNTLRDIEMNPDILDSVPNLKLNQAVKDKVMEQLSVGSSINKTMDVLTSLKLDPGIAFDLFDKYGLNTYQQLIDNPYILADIRPLLWPSADKIFQEQLQNNKANLDINAYTDIAMRYRSAIKFYLKLELDMTGSLAVKEKDLLDAFSSGEFLNQHGAFPDQPNNHPDDEVIKKRLAEMAEEGSIVLAKSKKDGYYVYMSYSYFAEQKIVKLIKQFNRDSSQQLASLSDVSSFIDEYERKTGFKLAKKQRLAVDLLVNNRISILTGGPGTGKTQTLLAVKDFVQYLAEKKLIPTDQIAFLAPTGKAARRMSEVLDVEAETIHRKLHLGGFGTDSEPQIIKESFVVVDETSMIDVQLFAQLLESLSPSAHILLVGDENQLPSVGAGLVLRDLIESNKVKTVLLDEVFRQSNGSLLIDNANKMKQGIGFTGDASGLVEAQADQTKLQDSYFLSTSSPMQTNKKLLQAVSILVHKWHKSLNDILVLTAQKSGMLGTNHLNNELQQIYNEHQDEPSITRKEDNVRFFIGDKIMQMTNDYKLDVFNGEIGTVNDIIISPNGTYTLEAEFPGHDDYIEYTGALINNINLAYAITIHKSQGSEAPFVVQVVDDSQNYMLSRSLIYTGYTRSKESNLMIGQKSALNNGLDNIDNLKRSSLIKEKL